MNKKLICLFLSATISTVFCLSEEDPHKLPRNDPTANGATENLQSNKPKVSLKKYRPKKREVSSAEDSSTGQTTKKYLPLGSSPVTQTTTNVRKKKDDDFLLAISPVAQSQMNIQFLSHDAKHPTLFKSLDGNMTANICIQNKIVMIQITSRSPFDSTKGQELRDYIKEKNINNYPVSIVFSGKQIGQWAFNGWPSLQRVVVQDNDVEIFKKAFVRNHSLNSIYLPRLFYEKNKEKALQYLGIDDNEKVWTAIDKGSSIQLKKNIDALISAAEQDSNVAPSKKQPISRFKDKKSFQIETVRSGVAGTVIAHLGKKRTEMPVQEYINSEQKIDFIDIKISGTPQDVFKNFFYPLARQGKINTLWKREAHHKIRFTDHIDTLFHGISVLTLRKIGQENYILNYKKLPQAKESKDLPHDLSDINKTLKNLQKIKNDFPELQKLSETELSDIALVLSSFPVAFLQDLSTWIVEMPCSSKWTDTIPEAAFRGCKLEEFPEIPERIQSIGSWAFSDLQNGVTVEIPKNVNVVGNYAFAHSRVTSAIITAENCKLGNFVFWGADDLTSVRLPDKLPYLNVGMFSGCSCLTATCDQKGNENLFEVPKEVKVIGSQCFYNCVELKNVVIPNNVQYIGPSAFSGCEKMSMVGNELPKDLQEICDNTFSNCQNMLLTKLPKNIIWIGKSAFKDCFKTTIEELPNNLNGIGDYAFAGGVDNNIAVMPQSVRYIGNGAFSHNLSMTTVTLPNSVTSIACKTEDDDDDENSVTFTRPVILKGEEDESGQFEIDAKGKLIMKNVNIPKDRGLGRNVFDQNVSLHTITMPQKLFQNIAQRGGDCNEDDFKRFFKLQKLSKSDYSKIMVLQYLGLLNPLDSEGMFCMIKYDIHSDEYITTNYYSEEGDVSVVNSIKNQLKIAFFENNVFNNRYDANFLESVESAKKSLDKILYAESDNDFYQMKADLANRWRMVVNQNGTVTLVNPVRKAIVEKMKEKVKKIQSKMEKEEEEERETRQEKLTEEINDIWLTPEEISKIKDQFNN